MTEYNETTAREPSDFLLQEEHLASAPLLEGWAPVDHHAWMHGWFFDHPDVEDGTHGHTSSVVGWTPRRHPAGYERIAASIGSDATIIQPSVKSGIGPRSTLANRSGGDALPVAATTSTPWSRCCGRRAVSARPRLIAREKPTESSETGYLLALPLWHEITQADPSGSTGDFRVPQIRSCLAREHSERTQSHPD